MMFNLNIEKLENLFNDVYNFSNDILIKFFIEKNIESSQVDEYVTSLFNLDVKFKEYFDLFNDEFNLVNKLINKIKDKEEYLLEQLEQLEEQENNKDNDELVVNINLKLDVIIEFQSIIYKIDSGYTKVDANKINYMLDTLDKI